MNKPIYITQEFVNGKIECHRQSMQDYFLTIEFEQFKTIEKIRKAYKRENISAIVWNILLTSINSN